MLSNSKSSDIKSKHFPSPEGVLAAGLVSAIILVALASASAYHNSFKAIEGERAAERSLELLATLESLFLVVKDVQAQAVEYLKRPNEENLEHYKRATKQLAPHMRNTKNLSDTDSRRAHHISYLEWLMSSLERHYDTATAERAGGGMSEDAAKQAAKKGFEMVQQIRNRVVYIELEQQKLVKSRALKSESDARSAANVFIALAVFLAVLFGLLLFIIRRHIRLVQASAESAKRISREIAENAPVGIILLDQQLKIVNANPMISDFLQIEGTELPGNSIAELLPELNDVGLKQADHNEAPKKRTALSIKRPSTREEHLFDTTSWAVMEGSELKGFILLLRDVTDEVRLSRQKELLLETIAHDLKTPLIACNYTVEALLFEAEKQKNKDEEMLEEIRESIEDVLTMVKQLLEFSRYDDGLEVLSFEDVELAPAIKESIDVVRPLAQHHDVELISALNGSNIAVRADRTAIVHLVSNLCTNAVKISPANSQVIVSAKVDKDFVNVSVTDQGPGLTQEDKEKIFRRFVKGERTRASYGSSGLGLYLCNEIVRLLGGEIAVETELGKGSSFIVKLPLLRTK
ncbi:MAG TPA: ATP-binding protein [Candidatus Melainabacteria bacterium]|nr:ATP-binding protein [Candidatus Melainabacteria bacterium]